MRILPLLFLLLVALSADAAYYVDFDTGVDADAGTSSGAPWKHVPGDPNATGTAASTTPAAGSTIYLKAGVAYKGYWSLTGSGTTGSRIIYDGSPPAWGTGKAIIDGTTNLSFTVCSAEGTGATQVQNANFASIYYATVPAGIDWQLSCFEDGTNWLRKSGTDVQADPWFYNNTDYFQAVSSGVAATSIADAAYLNQADANYWVGAVALVHVTGNAVSYATITSFNPATDTVSFASLGTPYQDSNWDNKYHYAIINSQRQLTGIGQYAVDVAGSRILVWPSNNIANVSIGIRPYGIHINGQSYVTLRNFIIRGQYGATFQQGRSITGTSSTATDGVLVEFCDISNSVDGGATATVYTYAAGTSNNVVKQNTFNRIYGRGIFGTGNGFTFQSNELAYVTGTVLYSQNHPSSTNRNGQYLDNYIHDCSGVHANGMTVYGGASYIASDFIIARNRVIRQYHRYGPFALSLQLHRNIRIENNVLDGSIADDGISVGSTYYTFINNVVTKTLRIFDADNCTPAPVVKNNICLEGMTNNNMEDWADWDRANNHFVTLTSRQDAFYGWTLESGGLVTTESALFGGAFTDGTITASSVAYNAGVDLTSDMVLELDAIRTVRPQSSAWDVGAYEYFSGAVPGSISASVGSGRARQVRVGGL